MYFATPSSISMRLGKKSPLNHMHMYFIFQIGWGFQPIPYDDPFFHDLHREWKYRKMESQAQGWALRFSAQVSHWQSEHQHTTLESSIPSEGQMRSWFLPAAKPRSSGQWQWVIFGLRACVRPILLMEVFFKARE